MEGDPVTQTEFLRFWGKTVHSIELATAIVSHRLRKMSHAVGKYERKIIASIVSLKNLTEANYLDKGSRLGWHDIARFCEFG